MIASTLFAAVIIISIIYLVVIRFLRWRWLSYILTTMVGSACVATGTVHLAYTGLEVFALGFLITKIDPLRYWPRSSKTSLFDRETDD